MARLNALDNTPFEKSRRAGTDHFYFCLIVQDGAFNLLLVERVRFCKRFLVLAAKQQPVLTNL